MKIARKLLILIAALGLAACLLAACGGAVKLSFETNGGSAVSAIEATPGEEVDLPVPERENYAFEGWYTSPDLTGPSYRGKIEAPAENTTYYAAWAKGYAVVLDLDGGTLAGATSKTVYVKEGDLLLDALAAFVPAKGDLAFGAWFFESGEEVTARDKMPASAVTLKAKYTVEYKLSVYLQNVSQTEYVKSEEESRTLRGFVGDTVSPEIEIFGFVHSEDNAGIDDFITLKETGRNELDYYFDRDTIDVHFNLNLPSGVIRTLDDVSAIFGATVTAPACPEKYAVVKVTGADEAVSGYRFAGWSKSPKTPGAGADYDASDEVTVDGYLTLFAVWDAGYSDRAGGNDIIFFPSADPSAAILYRGGMEFNGVREEDAFSFTLPDGTTKLEGKVFGTAFSYRRAGIDGTYYALSPYDDPLTEETVDSTISLVLDEYMNGTYTEPYGNSVVELHGIVFPLDEGMREFGFLVTDGESAGAGFSFRLGTQGQTKVFMQSQGEAGEYDGFLRINGGRGYTQLATGNYVMLDGFGGISYADNETMNYWEGKYYLETTYVNAETGNLSCVVIADVYGTDMDGNVSDTSESNRKHLEFYTIYLDDVDMYAFVERTREAGTYTGKYKASPSDAGTDAQLELDGLEIFQSATCTIADKTYTSAYTVTQTARGDVFVTMAFETDNNLQYFRLDAENGTFESYFPEESVSTEYFLLEEGNLNLPMLEIFDRAYTDPETKQEKGRYTKLFYQWVEGETTEFYEVAEGYVTSERIGSDAHGVELYTFFYTGALANEHGYNLANVPREMTFLLNNVTNGTSNYDVYYRFAVKYAGDAEMQPLYREIASKDGAKFLSIANIVGMGSLFYDVNGGTTDVYDGSLAISQNEIGDTIGVFTWINDGTYAYFYFTFEVDENGNPIDFVDHGTTPPEETAMFAMRNGVMDNEEATVILYGDIRRGNSGRMIYAPDGEWATGDIGTWKTEGSTVLGDRIFVFEGEEHNFSFVWEAIDYNDAGTLIEVYRYWMREGTSSDFSATYTDAQNGTLFLDGFRSIRYTDADNRQWIGDYYLSSDGRVLYFTSTDGTSFIFELTESGFRPLDKAYGYYEIEMSGEPCRLFFNGMGSVRLYGMTGTTPLGPAGTYTILESEEFECLVRITSGDIDGRTVFTVRLENGVLSFRDDSHLGIYVDDEWNLLVLDGYGVGYYYPASDGVERRGYFNLMDDDIDGNGPGKTGIAFLRFEDYSAMTFSFEPREGDAAKFTVATYPENYYYYNDNFSDLAYFRTDGIAYIGNRSGYYYNSGSAVEVYLLNAERGDPYLHVHFDVALGSSQFNGAYEYSYLADLTGEKVTVKNPAGHEVFYLYDGKTPVTVTGSVEFGDGTSDLSDVTITFTPDGSVPFNVEAAVQYGGKAPATARLISYYTPVESTETRREPILYVDGSYSFFKSFKYVKGGQDNGFTGIGGRVEYNFYDDFDNVKKDEDGNDIVTHIYSTLTRYHLGFGPLVIGDGEDMYKGTLYYIPQENGEVILDDSCKIEFDGVPASNRKVVDVDSANGTRYMLDFEVDGQRYAMFYYEDLDEGNYFTLYAFTTYSEVETGDYTVGVGKFVYANLYSFYGDPKRGDPVVLVLMKKGAAGKKEVVLTDFGSAFNKNGEESFLVDVIPEYDSRTGVTTEGHGYLISLGYAADGTLASAAVAEYEFRQAHTDDGLHAFNFFLGEDGSKLLFAMQTYDSEEDGYFFVALLSVTEKDGVWTVHAADGYVYTVEIRYGEDDEPSMSTDRVSWMVDVTSASEA